MLTPTKTPEKIMTLPDVPNLQHLTLPKENYNLQAGVTQFKLWPFSTIEWLAGEKRFKARAIIQNKNTRDLVAFNSSHEEYDDAERAIALLSDSMKGIGMRRLYNIFAETIEIHVADIGGGPPVTVTEVRPRIWSMQEFTA